MFPFSLNINVGALVEDDENQKHVRPRVMITVCVKHFTVRLSSCAVSLQPFWPLGTGIARGFLAAFDTAWMVRSWGMGVPHLKVLAER